MNANSMLNQVLDISIKLSSEKNTKTLLESILLAAKSLSNADGGTIYSVNDNQELVFDTLFNDSLELHMGGSSGHQVTFDPIPIFIGEEINTSAIVSYAAASGKTININDIYHAEGYDLTRAKDWDALNNYRTQSVLTMPMMNHEGELNGVLQLINARNDEQVVTFDHNTEHRVTALTSLASVALTNRQLIDNMEELFQAFTRLIAKAIDEKSPYTGGHCRRVPELTMMIAEAVHRHEHGPMADFTMNDADRHELNLAGWIHDCGKVATPEYVLDKSKKLETVFDRIELVKTRFELAKREVELNMTKQLLVTVDRQTRQKLQKQMEEELARLQTDYDFICHVNTGSEFMSEDDQQRLTDIAQSRQVVVNDETLPLLSEDEVYNLQTARGTLNNEERNIINKHMDITAEMLESLPFPKHLRRVPEFACGHHEKMDGTGYPRGLTREQMSIPARIMAIADIFEALSATDRPYKEANKISECLKIMGKMRLENHIDPDLFEVFIKEKVFEEYAKKFLKPEQLDDIRIEDIPGMKANPQ